MFRRVDKKGIFLPAIEIHDHPQKGWICVAAANIQKGELIERCPTIKLAPEAMQELFDFVDGRTNLHDYVFSTTIKGYAYWAMGYGGVYSHSSNPNARWKISRMPDGRDTVDIRAIRDISKGEEITHSYVKPEDEELLWFDAVE